MFGWKDKVKDKKMERKKLDRKEKEEKIYFSSLLFGWGENGKKMIKKKMRVA